MHIYKIGTGIGTGIDTPEACSKDEHLLRSLWLGTFTNIFRHMHVLFMSTYTWNPAWEIHSKESHFCITTRLHCQNNRCFDITDAHKRTCPHCYTAWYCHSKIDHGNKSKICHVHLKKVQSNKYSYWNKDIHIRKHKHTHAYTQTHTHTHTRTNKYAK